MRTALFCSALFMAGCTTSAQYYDNAQLVMVEGREFFVSRRVSRGENVFLAGPNQPTGKEVFLGGNLGLPRSNVVAIEAVTGCKVVPETVFNVGTGDTFAEVQC